MNPPAGTLPLELRINKLPPDDDAFSAWEQAETINVERYWSGETAPPLRHFTARLLWSDEHLFVRFDHKIAEPPVVSDEPVFTQKTIGLWEYDVCEIFIAPDTMRPEKYFEFEIAPTGEWLDLAIEHSGGERIADREYISGLQAFAENENGQAVMILKIPFSAFGSVPTAGTEWSGNIFRCVGGGETRGYLSWQPTRTPRPNFHVPARFGKFIFS